MKTPVVRPYRSGQGFHQAAPRLSAFGRTACAVSLLLALAGAAPILYAQQGLLGTNLVVNPSAENGAGAVNDVDVVPVAGWETISGFTAVRYGVLDFPTVTDPGPVTRGVNFFAGGPTNAYSAAWQIIDVTDSSTLIDSAKARYTLSGYLGGWSGWYLWWWWDQDDCAVLGADFKNAQGTVLGSCTMPPVFAYDRGSTPGTFYRSASSVVPPGTRRIEVWLEMYRIDDVFNLYNDAYADNISLILTEDELPSQGMFIYADGLENNWQNASTATVNYGNGSPVHSGTKSASVSASAWKAFAVHHDPRSTSNYAALSFWINGGASGDQLLEIVATCNGVEQPGLLLPGVAANKWVEVVVPLADLAVANVPNLDGFLIRDWSGATEPTFYLDDIKLAGLAEPPLATVSGRVLGEGLPLTNATVQIDQQPYLTCTKADGRFTLTNVAPASGYVLGAIAEDFAPFRRTDLLVTAGSNYVGDLVLTNLSRPYRVIPLVPDVNPEFSEVEDGGVAYRYYSVVAADGKTAAPATTVALEHPILGPIDQSSDVSEIWAGRVAGISDPDGIVRLRIPAAALGLVGSVRVLNVLESGVVKASFPAHVVARKYDQVWKHKAGAEAGASLGVVLPLAVHGGAALAYETELRHSLEGGVLQTEQIKRTRDAELRLGLEVVSPGIKLVGGGRGFGGVGGLGGAEVSSTFRFDPTTRSSSENAMKLYVALGDPLSIALGPAKGFCDVVRETVEPTFLRDNLVAAEGLIRLGGYFDAQASIGLKASRTVGIGVGARLAGEAEGLFGYEEVFDVINASRAFEIGRAASISGSFQGGAFITRDQGLGLSLFAGIDGTFKGKVVFKEGSSQPNRIEIEQTVGVDLVGTAGLLQFNKYKLGGGTNAEYPEKLSFDLPASGLFSRLNAYAPIWGVVSGGGQGGLIQSGTTTEMLSSVLQLALNDQTTVEYSKSVYGGDKAEFALGSSDLAAVSIPGIGTVSLGVGGSVAVEKGAEVVNERGRIWQFKRMALESYPALTTGMFPTHNIVDLEMEWAANASRLIEEALHEATHTVPPSGPTVIQVGCQSAQSALAILYLNPGVLPSGSIIISSYVLNLVCGSAAGPSTPQFGPRGGPEPGPLEAATNLVYGLGGTYRFESTNAFNGTGSLSISYSDAEVIGLNEADLRIYHLPDGTNRWRLIGGTVNTASNSVTATITNLGTFAVAPPLPTGDLWLQSSTNLLPADGSSLLTVTASNLMLNTGGSAAQAWLFTAAAVGLELLSPDVETNLPGVQVLSSNATVTLRLRAPLGGSSAGVFLVSVAGDASGRLNVNLLDDSAPTAPSGLAATAGQSRIWASWHTNSEPDVAGYRVHYRTGRAGPPWDGTAAVEGTASPVSVAGTNVMLRGLALGTNYFLAVSAVDTTGNEGAQSTAIQVTTAQTPPSMPTGVAVRFGEDGTNILMWALSEDDGYNDRDVIHYEVWRAVLPGTNWVKVGERPAGLGLFSTTNISVTATQFVRYAVQAVDAAGLASPLTLANRGLPSGVGVDNDGDGMPDDWEATYGLDPLNPVDGAGDLDGDALDNADEYHMGRNPSKADPVRFGSVALLSSGQCALTIEDALGRSLTLQVSTNLSDWFPSATFAGSNAPIHYVDSETTHSTRRFYRTVIP